MRILLTTVLLIGHAYVAVAAEVLTEATVLEVDKTRLREFRGGTDASFIVNVSEAAARSLGSSVQSRTLQSFRLTTVDERPAQFRVSSRLGSLEVGIDFELTAGISVKREIKLIVSGQMNVRRRDNELDLPVSLFAGESVRHEITSAEGASIVVSGFVTEREAQQLVGMEALRDNPLLAFLSSQTDSAVDLVLVLTPHVIRAPTIADVTPRVVLPAPRQDGYTVQVAAFQSRANALALLADLQKRYADVFIEEPGSGQRLYRVRVGRFANTSEGKELLRQLRNEGFKPFISDLR